MRVGIADLGAGCTSIGKGGAILLDGMTDLAIALTGGGRDQREAGQQRGAYG